ncbi:MCE family protein [Amycolatopsis orientalis]|uniref:MCE family protein n=1 Tax=Amycolatopsis orientalis TaxID=31958 RepID=UPI000559CF10|nr:MlaD family protein [Amycolatopsis orientalis]
MLLRRIKIQITVFAVLAAVGVGYAGWRYAGLDRLFGHRGYQVTVQLSTGGGLFAGADVTYRGVGVGRVSALELTSAGVDARLDIDPDAPRIPAKTQAVVANRSAVGEQYLDLRPSTDAGPYLADGSRIAQQDTALPVRPETLLSSADALLSHLPADSLRTVVDELDKAFAGKEHQLRQLLDATGSLVAAGTEHAPQTRSLLSDGRTVVQTQKDLAEPITSFGSDLHALAAQLKTSDPDLRKLINVTPDVARQVSDVLRQSGSDLSVLTANLLTTANVVKTRVNGIEQTLVVSPYLPVLGSALLPGDGTAHMGFILNFFNPPACTKGYENTTARPGSDTREAAPNQQAYCAEPPGSPVNVRGAQNAPYGGQPQAAAAPAAQPAAPPVPVAPITSLGGLLGLPG